MSLQKMCEGCGLKQPSHFLPGERRKRWCGGCAAAGGGGGVSLPRKICWGCGLKMPNYGLSADRRKRWCGGCAKAADGRGAAKDVRGSGSERFARQRKMCEGCGLKQPTFGLPAEGRKARWCAGCAAAEGKGAVSLSLREGKEGQSAQAVAAAQAHGTQQEASARELRELLGNAAGATRLLVVGQPLEPPPARSVVESAQPQPPAQKRRRCAGSAGQDAISAAATELVQIKRRRG